MDSVLHRLVGRSTDSVDCVSTSEVFLSLSLSLLRAVQQASRPLQAGTAPEQEWPARLLTLDLGTRAYPQRELSPRGGMPRGLGGALRVLLCLASHTGDYRFLGKGFLFESKHW